LVKIRTFDRKSKFWSKIRILGKKLTGAAGSVVQVRKKFRLSVVRLIFNMMKEILSKRMISDFVPNPLYIFELNRNAGGVGDEQIKKKFGFGGRDLFEKYRIYKICIFYISGFIIYSWENL